MSVQSDNYRSGPYVGNNSTVTLYPVDFYFLNTSEVFATLTDADGEVSTLSHGVGLTVTGALEEEGGSATTTTAWDSTYTLTFYRSLPATQPLVLDENADLPAKSLETAYDRVTLLVQQALRLISNSVRFEEAYGPINELVRQADSVISDDGNTIVFLDRSALLAWLSLPTPVLNFPQKVWLNDAQRAVAVPDYVGQLGVQRAESRIYISTGASAGNWAIYYPALPGSAVTSWFPDDFVPIFRTSPPPGFNANISLSNLIPKQLGGYVTGFNCSTLSGTEVILGWSEAVLNRIGSINQSFQGTSLPAVDISSVGVDGLDTGSPADGTWYYIWIIAGTGTNSHGLISLSSTSPTMPAGYTAKLCVSAFYYDTMIRPYIQSGNVVDYISEVPFATDQVATNGVITTIAADPAAPPAASRIRGNIYVETNTGSTHNVYIGDTRMSNATSGGTFAGNAGHINGFYGSVAYDASYSGNQITWISSGTVTEYTFTASGFTLNLV